MDKKKSNDLLASLASTEFIDFCNKKLFPSIAPLEKERLSCIALSKKLHILGRVLFVAGAAMFFLPLIHINNFLWALIISFAPLNGIVLLFAGIIIGMLSSAKKRSFVDYMKSQLYESTLSFWGDFKYHTTDIKLPNPGYYDTIRYKLESKLKELKLFEFFTNFDCDDYITGVFNGLNLEIADIIMVNENVKINNKPLVPFEGIYISVDCHKKFDSTTIIRTDKGIRNPLSVENLERVALEDTLFEQAFEVYSDNQIEARYLLTTSFMERLLKAQRTSRAKIACSFEKGKMFIALYSEKNWFDFSIEKSLLDIRNHQSVLVDLAAVLNVIESLRIDSNIGM